MKYFKKIILFNLIILIHIVFPKDISKYDSIINKKFNYKLEFENIVAGNAFISIKEDLSQNNKTLQLISKLKTNRFMDFFYKIRDEINISMNFNDYSLIEVINKIRQGKYRKEHHAKINMQSMEIIANNKSKIITEKIYSPLSSPSNVNLLKVNSSCPTRFRIYGAMFSCTIIIVSANCVKSNALEVCKLYGVNISCIRFQFCKFS